MRSAILVLLLATGCFLPELSRKPDYEALVQRYEQTEPASAELAADDLRSTHTILREIGDLESRLGYEIKKAHADPSLLTRLQAARRRFQIAAATSVRNPGRAVALLIGELATADAEVLALLERRGAQVVVARQVARDRTGSYRQPRYHDQDEDNYEVWSKTSPPSIGNCVVAQQPFPSGDQPNQRLAVITRRDESVHVRCYLETKIGRLGTVVALIDGATRPITGYGATVNQIDFVISQPRKPSRSDKVAAYIPIQLLLVISGDNIVVPDREGNLRLRREWRRVLLADGGFVRINDGATQLSQRR